MPNNNVKPRPSVNVSENNKPSIEIKRTVEVLNTKQMSQSVKEIIEGLLKKYPMLLCDNVIYKDVQFAFGDIVNIFGQLAVVTSAMQKEMKIYVVRGIDFLNCFDLTKKERKKGIWVKLDKYAKSANDLRIIKQIEVHN